MQAIVHASQADKYTALAGRRSLQCWCCREALTSGSLVTTSEQCPAAEVSIPAHVATHLLPCHRPDGDPDLQCIAAAMEGTSAIIVLLDAHRLALPATEHSHAFGQHIQQQLRAMAGRVPSGMTIPLAMVLQVASPSANRCRSET